MADPRLSLCTSPLPKLCCTIRGVPEGSFHTQLALAVFLLRPLLFVSLSSYEARKALPKGQVLDSAPFFAFSWNLRILDIIGRIGRDLPDHRTMPSFCT